MKIDSATDAFWVLYLINVLQPISRADLEAQTRHFMKTLRGEADPDVDIAGTLEALVGANLAIALVDGRYAVTASGLNRLSVLKLGRIRDKNRLFLLKKLLKEE